MKELEILRRVLKILENTTNDIMAIVKELKSIDTKVDDEHFRIEISDKGKHHGGRKNN